MATEPLAGVADMIRFLRGTGFSLERIADEVGVAASTVLRMERNDGTKLPDAYCKLLRLYASRKRKLRDLTEGR